MFSKLMAVLASALSVCASPIVLRQTAGPPATGTVGSVNVEAPGGYGAGGLESNGGFAQGGDGSNDYVLTNVPGGITLKTSTGQCGIVKTVFVCGPGTPATTFAVSGDSDFASFAVSAQGWEVSGGNIVEVASGPNQIGLTFSPNDFN